MKVILSFDYELFLGNPSGHVPESLLAPTEKVLELLDKKNSKAVFFIDVCFLQRCRTDAPQSFSAVASQIKRIYQKGHELGLHTHPHWCDARYESGQWRFQSFDKYRLHSFESAQIKEIFEGGVQVLHEIVEDPHFKPEVFRAGGWCVQPFSSLKPAFQSLGLRVDSSVLPRFSADQRPLHFYEFSEAPEEQLWKFSTDPLKPQDDGDFVEVPVSVTKVSTLELVINKILLRLKNEKVFGDGRGIGAKSSNRTLKKVFQSKFRKFTVEGTSGWLLRRMLRRAGKRDLLHFVMHPKSLTPEALCNMEFVLQNASCTTISAAVRQYED